MSKYIPDQPQYVRAFINAADQPAWTNLSNEQLEQARLKWFHNTLNRRSLRLTHEGFKVVNRMCDVEIYSFTLPEKILPKTLLQLERHMQGPYYIRNLKLIKMTSEQDSIMLSLHGNDLQQWLDQLDSSQ